MPSRLGVCAAAAIALLACDFRKATRGAATGSATQAPAASSSASQAKGIATGTSVFPKVASAERWPEPAADSGREFTAGIVEHKPPPRAVALLTDVRAARHDGFDRIVFEFGSGSPPGYHLEYIDRPVRKCGSGDATAIAGDGWLEVRIEPAHAHTPSGAPTIRDRDQQLDLGVVKELEQTCDFEAIVSWVVGVKRPNRYRVLTLNEPLRLVVDVKH
ncbi:MAG TPA: hypothetical protein VEX18_04890 [Polyangiaceae bacterium]|nr:hypothetical protein [Polyangiaceae bacterium]